MKNVLYITYDGLLDAVSRSQVLPYLKELSKGRFNITVLSFEKVKIIKGEKAFDSLKEELKKYGIKWLPLRYHKSPVIPATIFDVLQGFFLGLRSIYLKRICVIHARSYIAALVGLFLKYITGKKLMFDMRGFWPDEKVDGGVWSEGSFVYSVVKRIEKLLIIKSDEIIVLTEAAKRYLCSISHGVSVAVIPCCVDIKVFSADANKLTVPDKANGRFIITYLGSLGTFYDLKGMLSFFKIFKSKKKDAFFWIIANSINESIRALIQESISDNCDYAISKSDYRDVPSALAGSDVSIMFYRRRLSGIGCSPIKFAESLSCGVPVVINSGIGDTGELVRRERVGIIVDSASGMNFEKSADELSQLLSEGDTLRHRCRNVAEQYFSLDSAINEYGKIYQRILEQ